MGGAPCHRAEKACQFTLTITDGNIPEVNQIFVNQINKRDYKVLEVRGKEITLIEIEGETSWKKHMSET